MTGAPVLSGRIKDEEVLLPTLSLSIAYVPCQRKLAGWVFQGLLVRSQSFYAGCSGAEPVVQFDQIPRAERACCQF